jgi:ADP-ribosylglycohydrolase
MDKKIVIFDLDGTLLNTLDDLTDSTNFALEYYKFPPRTVDEIRPYYKFDVSCQGSVPESIICFLEAEDYEDTIRNCISLGGDADTMAAIAGGVASAYWEVPNEIHSKAIHRLSYDLLDVLIKFENKFL